MIITIGERDTILHEGYLHSTPCNKCYHQEQNYVSIWAKSFVFGPSLIPIKWATWGKKAVVTCNNCHKTSDISETSGYLRERMDNLTNENPLWKKNILGIIIITYFALSFVSSIVFGIFGIFADKKPIVVQSSPRSVVQSIIMPSDSLKGSWLAPNIFVENERIQEMSNLDSKVVDITKEEFEFEIFRFSGDKKFMGIKNGLFQESKWDISKNEIQLFDGTNIRANKFEITQAVNQRMSMKTSKFFNDIPVNFNIQMFRFNLGKDEVIFYDYAAKIFKNVSKSETDSEIKEKVKNSLNFYSIYFQAINNSNLNGFKPTAVLLPIRFYSGGIGITEFDEQQYWKKIYSEDFTTAEKEKIIQQLWIR